MMSRIFWRVLWTVLLLSGCCSSDLRQATIQTPAGSGADVPGDEKGDAGSGPTTADARNFSGVDFSGRYYFHGPYMDWNNASQYCRGNHSHLAFPDSREEADIIEALMIANGASQIHIGMHDLFEDGKYYTITGDLVADGCYLKWGAGYPVGGPVYNCGGYITPDGLLDQSCADLYPFICEKDMWNDYELLGNGYYKLHEEWISWPNASAVCEAEGAHLLIINSEEEYTLLRDEWEFDWCWVGVQQVLENREFVTIFGDSLTSTNYSRFAQGEPWGVNTVYPYVKLIDFSGLFTSYSEGPFICEHELD